MFFLLLTVVLAQELLWAPYRPQLYFGVRPQLPESLLTGLLWFRSNDLRGVTHLRHTIGNGDTVSKFGWEAYDARVGGRQRIYDSGNRVNLTIDFVKSSDGKAWEARVVGEQSPTNILSLVHYAGLESAKRGMDTDSEFLKLSPVSKRRLRGDGIEGNDVTLSGRSEKLGGDFRLVLEKISGEAPLHSHEYAQRKPGDNIHYASLFVPGGEQWKAHQIYLTLVQDEVGKFVNEFGDDDNDIPVWAVLCADNLALPDSNLHFAQMSFTGPFEFRIRYAPKSHIHLFEAGEELHDIDERIGEVLQAQHKRFNDAFALQSPYAGDERLQRFANEMVSDVAAGVGYFYGDSLVRSSELDDADSEEVAPGVTRVPPRELLSGTPSRAFFPRGFYWDEGFNSLVLLPYDTDLALRIMRSWFATMDEDGYIQREQILGEEARSLVPEEFQVQDRTIANPPTLVMALAHLADGAGSKEARKSADALLTELYPRLQKHFQWFRRTQRGDTLQFDRDYPSQEVYRWRGRTSTHCLASGLDDYPRAPEVSVGDLHVDLVAWVGAMADALAHIANRLGLKQDAAKYLRIREDVQSNLESVFYDEKAGYYCDVGIDEYEEDARYCHLGYVSHLPFMLKLVPETSTNRLLSLMKHLRNEEELWSVAGIRSLSKSDKFFGTGENYWRGPVWNNMNYLTLDALHHYATSSSCDPSVRTYASEIYRELRATVVENIYREYRRTGFVWESYNSLTGEAKGAKAFTGWGALVANMMAMPETPVVEQSAKEPVEEPAVEESTIEEPESTAAQETQEAPQHDEL